MRLPQYQPNQVQVQSLPGPSISTNAPPEAFGAGLGRGLQSFGADVATVANYEEAQANNAIITDGLSQIDDFDSNRVYDGPDALLSMSGKPAMDAIAPLQKERAALYANIRKGMNPKQQALFDRAALTRNSRFGRTLNQSQTRAGFQIADDSHKNAMAKINQNIVAAGKSQVALFAGAPSRAGAISGTARLSTRQTDEMIGEGIEQIDAYWDLNGRRYADPEGERAKEMAGFITASHTQIIKNALARGDVDTAIAYFDEKKDEIVGPVKDEVQATITRVRQDQLVAATVAEAAEAVPLDTFEPPREGVERPDKLEVKAAAHKAIEARFANEENGEALAKEANKQFDSQLEAAETQANEQRKAWAAELDKEISGGAEWSEITSDKRYDRLDNDQQKAMAKSYNAHLRGEDTVSKPEKYEEIFTQMATNDPAFLDQPIAQLKRDQVLSKEDGDYFEAEQVKRMKAKESGSGYAGTITPEEQIHRRANELWGGSNSRDTKKRGAFESKISATLRAQFSGPDQKPTYDDVQKALDDATVQVVYGDGTYSGIPDWLGAMFDSGTSFEDLGEKEALQAIQAMQADPTYRGLVTPSNVVRYLAYQKAKSGE